MGDQVNANILGLTSEYKESFSIWPVSEPIVVPVSLGKNVYELTFEIQLQQINQASVVVNDIDVMRILSPK
jgi:hypothetical protein